MLAPVIAAVDGSEESLAAAAWAAREAVRRERPLSLLHAWNRHPREQAETATAAQRHLALRVLRTAEERILEGCPDVVVHDEQVEGPATAALLRAAGGCDTLVLGSRGLSGFTGFLVGSVALGVVAHAPCPVVLVRAGEESADEHRLAADGSASTRTAYRDVVLGVDLADPCDEVIGYAFEAARTRGARLRAVHARRPVAPPLLGPGGIGPVDETRRTETRRAEAWQAEAWQAQTRRTDEWRAEEWRCFLAAVLHAWRDKYPGVEVVETIAEDHPRQALVRAASDASLLVVGRRDTGRPAGPRTGRVAHAVIHHAGCPVAVVPHA
ncbi:universal stress protein [Streptomyces mangrovisoli]|uniref:Stress protein n=1 Tax=Streptomyces mangrovisoli TaxID=1428628 RepID=A0A1J4P5C0_9ACTN|nr:universal stress protein [Streptomyces mangrovisoli]OIJ68670.1 stress protein [Streptomyces mangrovisoli]